MKRPLDPAVTGTPTRGGPSKRARGQNGEWRLSKARKITVGEYKGSVRVDIREYYEKDGEEKPGHKGANLSTDEWRKLRALVNEVSTVVNDMGVSEREWPIAAKRLRVSTYKSARLVDIRRVFQKGGETKYGKGISLTADQWAKLDAAASDVSACLDAREAGGGGGLPGPRDSLPPQAPKSAQLATPELGQLDPTSTKIRAIGQPPKALQSAQPAAAELAQPTSTKRGPSPDASWQLSARRKVSVRSYRGSELVDIREYYEKNGQQMPGRKGLSMTLDQWRQFTAQLDLIRQGFCDETEGTWRLGGPKVVQTLRFKGTWRVDFRTMYKKNGKETPGFKGIMLTAEQWDKLVVLAPDVTAAIGA